MLMYFRSTSSKTSGTFAEWTIDDQGALAVAFTPKNPDPALRTWWEDCGGESGTAVDQSCST
jgi:hypothetical protein